MRKSRFLGLAAIGAVATAGPLSMGLASAQEPATGVGSAEVSATVLGVELGADGSLLSIRVLGDDGRSTIDPSVGTPSSSTALRPLTITSETVPALRVEAPGVETRSSGERDETTVQPFADVPSTPAFTGSATASLFSVVDDAGARSGLDAAVDGVDVAGALLSMPSAVVQLGTDAATGDADASRVVEIPAMTVLDLGALLEGLGVSLADLPVDTVLALLGSLGVDVPGIGDAEAVAAVVDELNAAIDLLQGQSGDLTEELCRTVDDGLDTVGGVVGLPPLGEVIDGLTGGTDVLGAAALPEGYSCDEVSGTVQDLVDTLQDDLSDLLAGVLATLDGTALLSVSDVQAGLVARATDSVDTSVADVTASIGEVRIGELSLPALADLDLTDAAATLDVAEETVRSTIGDVLATIDADLSGLVDVDLLDIVEQVGAEGEYTNALASLTALRVTIDPSALTGVLDSAAITDAASIGEAIESLGGTVPALAAAMATLEGALGGIDALAAPSTITVGTLSSSAAFVPATASSVGQQPAPAPGGTLPRTGADAALPAMLGVAMAGAAIGIIRWLRSTGSVA